MRVENDKNTCCETKKRMGKIHHPMVPELVQASPFYFPTYEEFMAASTNEGNNYVYTHGTSPITETLEREIVRLKHGEKCRVFASRMGAISATLFTLLQQGGHVLTVNTIYGESASFMQCLRKLGVPLTKVDVAETEELFRFVQENTKVIYFESPSSQKSRLLDLEKVTALVQKIGAYTVIDNTWASPLSRHPLCYNADLVTHSCSKYTGGRSGIVAGVTIGKVALVDQTFEHGHQALGIANSPFNSWLVSRGVRTMPIWLAYQSQVIQTVLLALREDPRIGRLYHPFVGNQ